MLLEKDINSETKKLQKELDALGYDFNKLLGGCHKPRENYLDIAETLTRHLDKKYHWHNIQKIIKTISFVIYTNLKLVESNDQTNRRHKVIQSLVNQFNKPFVGHNHFEVTEYLQQDLDRFKNNIEELIQHACSYSLCRSIYFHIEADDIFLSTIVNFWETCKNPLIKKELFSCLISFVRAEEIFLSKLDNTIENKSFVKSFLEHDNGFLSYGNSYYREINHRKKLITLIEQLDCNENTQLKSLAREKVATLKQTDSKLSELSILFQELTKSIFINPRVKIVRPEYVHKKQWKFVAETLIQNTDKELYWGTKFQIFSLLGEDWYSSNYKLRYLALEKLFKTLEAKSSTNLKTENSPELTEIPKDLDSRLNESIAVSISLLIKPANKIDKKLYFEKLKGIVEKKSMDIVGIIY